MPISLSALEDQTSTVDVFKILNQPRDLWGQLMVKYYLYPDFSQDEDAEREQIQREGDPEKVADSNSKYASRLIISWDLLDHEDKPIPVDQASIRAEVPTHILTMILTAMGRDRAKVGPRKKN